MVRTAGTTALLLLFSVQMLPAQSLELRALDGTSRQGSVGTAPTGVLYAVGGSLVGGWIGYMASQVRYSDWDREEHDDLPGIRRRYALMGAGAGSLLGLGVSVRVGHRPPGPVVPPLASRALPSSITREELRAGAYRDAFQAVQALRPQWLVTRGAHSLREAPGGVGGGTGSGAIVAITRERMPTIAVYLGEVRLGTVENLREIATTEIEMIRFVPADAATIRWGSGHTHGVIQIVPLKPDAY
jgi:hypothetical protein